MGHLVRTALSAMVSGFSGTGVCLLDFEQENPMLAPATRFRLPSGGEPRAHPGFLGPRSGLCSHSAGTHSSKDTCPTPCRERRAFHHPHVPLVHGVLTSPGWPLTLRFAPSCQVLRLLWAGVGIPHPGIPATCPGGLATAPSLSPPAPIHPANPCSACPDPCPPLCYVAHGIRS